MDSGGPFGGCDGGLLDGTRPVRVVLSFFDPGFRQQAVRRDRCGIHTGDMVHRDGSGYHAWCRCGCRAAQTETAACRVGGMNWSTIEPKTGRSEETASRAKCVHRDSTLPRLGVESGVVLTLFSSSTTSSPWESTTTTTTTPPPATTPTTAHLLRFPLRSPTPEKPGRTCHRSRQSSWTRVVSWLTSGCCPFQIACLSKHESTRLHPRPRSRLNPRLRWAGTGLNVRGCSSQRLH